MSKEIKKENIMDMPDNSDMIAEAMKEVTVVEPRLNMQLTLSKLSTSCPNISSRNSMRSMEPTGIVLLAKISAPTSATRPKIISFSMRDS